MNGSAELCDFNAGKIFKKMRQAFDSYPDGDGNVIIITTDFDENGDRNITENHIPIHRAKQIYLALGKSLGLPIIETLREIQAKDIDHKMKNGSFFLPQYIRQKIASIFFFFA